MTKVVFCSSVLLQCVAAVRCSSVLQQRVTESISQVEKTELVSIDDASFTRLRSQPGIDVYIYIYYHELYHHPRSNRVGDIT